MEGASDRGVIRHIEKQKKVFKRTCSITIAKNGACHQGGLIKKGHFRRDRFEDTPPQPFVQYIYLFIFGMLVLPRDRLPIETLI